MADKQSKEVVISTSSSVKLSRWRVSAGSEVREGSVLCFYEVSGKAERTGSFVTQPKLKSAFTGKVRELLVAEGDIVPAGAPVLLIDKATECEHKMVMKDLCCDCGADLRKLNEEQDEPSSPTLASVPLIHNIPELKVSPEEAEALGKKDEARLLKTRKLSLIVDLDQTLIHTTMELIPEDMEDVHHFQLPGYPVWYHTKIRPGAVNFLKSISELYELHIFTMGSRMYAHTIARMLDPDGKLFAYRIRSRDECFNAFSKSHDMRSLFPCGDNMVCIIDDREDVWNFAPNLIHVKPYQFFKGVGDINAPPGSTPSPEEEFASPAEEVGEENNPEKDIEAEEVNSLETEDVAHQEKNDDTVFKDNKKSEETEIDVVLNEKMSLGKLEENVEVTEDKIEPVGEGVDEISAKKSSVDNVKSNVDSSKVLENGQSENADDETKPEESNETKEINQNDKEENEEGEKNNNGDTKGDKEQTTSICNDEITPEKSCGGVQTKFKKSQKYSYEFGDGDDDYLLHLEDVLKRVHEVFYKTLDEIKSISAEELKGNPNSTSGVKYCTPGTTTPDAKAIVTELRRDVLLGANIVFTGVIPTSTKQEESYPWRVAYALGAKVSNTIVTPKDTTNPSDVTTHMIAGRLGTEKSYRAVKTRGVRLVNPGWLFCCSERWEWVDERLFPVEGLEKYKQQIRDQGTPRGTPRDTVMENDDLGTGDTGEDAENKSRSESVSSADILMSTLNPLLSFSPSEVEAMDKEVEDLMNASDEESDLIGSVSDSSSSSDSEDSKSTSKRKRVEEEESQEDANNESPSKKRKVSDDVDDDDEVKDIDNDNDHEGEGGSEDSSKSDSDDDYTHRSSPSDDDDDMAAMLDAELAQS